ncbi:MAG: hypothetical protein E7160_03340 [Firmicutes bacterium]|nr:hypothetical protein [Bacillota bacterium]
MKKSNMHKISVADIPDVVKIAKAHDIKVSECFFSKQSTIVNAAYNKGNNKCEILINPDLKYYFKRFLVAYMFSYMQLYDDDCYVVFDETLYDRAAYNNALDLLMPDDVFIPEYLNKLNLDQITKLSNLYNVSVNLIYDKRDREKEKNKIKILKMKEK